MESIGIRRVEQGVAAVSKFSGRATEEIVRSKEKELRSALVRDGLNPREGCLFARYNDPGRTWSFIMVRLLHPPPFLRSIVSFSLRARDGLAHSHAPLAAAVALEEERGADMARRVLSGVKCHAARQRGVRLRPRHSRCGLATPSC